MSQPVIDQPGIYDDVPFEDYLKIDAVSQSDLKHIARSPAHYKAYKESPPDATPAMDIGSAIDDKVFLPGVFARNYVRTELTRRGTNAWKDEASKLRPGQILLKAPDYDHIATMLESLRTHKMASILLADGVAQRTLVWRDPETGLLCKARPDWVNVVHEAQVDLKSTEDARESAWVKIAARLRYNVQDAFYSWGNAILEQPSGAFFFVVIERKPPHAVQCYALPVDARLEGGRLFRRDIIRLAECLTADKWPAYGDQIVTPLWPKWALENQWTT